VAAAKGAITVTDPFDARQAKLVAVVAGHKLRTAKGDVGSVLRKIPIDVFRTIKKRSSCKRRAGICGCGRIVA